MSPRFNFGVDEGTAGRFRAFAKTQRRGVGNLAVVAIEEYIGRKEADRKRIEGRQKVRKIDPGGEGPAGLVAGSPPTDSEGGPG